MSRESQRDLLWLSDEILDKLDKEKVVVFRDNDNQPYSIFCKCRAIALDYGDGEYYYRVCGDMKDLLVVVKRTDAIKILKS